MSPYRITEQFVGDTEIGKVMSGLTNVELADGVVRFVKEEGKIPKDTLTNEQVDQSSQRLFMFLGIAASIFLFFVAVIIFVGLRAKKRRERIEGPDEPA
jgi:ABC-type multidrug transport system permease subunit